MYIHIYYHPPSPPFQFSHPPDTNKTPPKNTTTGAGGRAFYNRALRVAASARRWGTVASLLKVRYTCMIYNKYNKI